MNPRDDIIQLKVPNDAGSIECLNVHRGVLCKSSGFFQKAMKPEWTKLGEEKTVDLPDDLASTVSDYIVWLYQGSIAIKPFLPSTEPIEERARKAEKVYLLLAEAYVFGQKILDSGYKNAVVKAIFSAQMFSGWNMGPNCVTTIYEGTPPESPARRLFADKLAHSAYDDSANGFGWMQCIDGYPQEALTDAMKALLRVRKAVGRAPVITSYLEKEQD
ncbi:uncharacterized protein J4E92_003601 [Alternaria infectoria]|uniref:uncharacterized protein n=1 Tax=Alternaria infectoria TaxID=45303 RepID=UPI002221181A|nr:uncharacterized protein J4E92_003601 [Alternaria infectoria]KAI4933931.1 hypothetical protein J4E92_003601 [Alternaria infectoria]